MYTIISNTDVQFNNSTIESAFEELNTDIEVNLITNFINHGKNKYTKTTKT